MKSKLTNDDVKTLKSYLNDVRINIDYLLTKDSRNDIADVSEVDDSNITYQKEKVEEYLNLITEVYNIILNSYYSKELKRDWYFYKVLNLDDIEKYKNEPCIDNFLTCYDDTYLKSKDLIIGNNEVIVKFIANRYVPYIDLKDIKDKSGGVLISLFTEVKDIKEVDPININGKDERCFEITLDNQKLDVMEDDEKTKLYRSIIDNSDLINSHLTESANLEKNNTQNYEEIRDLEKEIIERDVIEKTESDNGVKSDVSIDELNERLNDLKTKSAEMFEKIKTNNKIISDWKEDIITYLKAECEEVKEVYIEKMNSNDKEEDERIQNYEMRERLPKEEIEKLKYKDLLDEVKNECEDNCVLVKRLISEIDRVISRQQKFAKIAQEIESRYSALNNCFEMKEKAEELEDLITGVKNIVLSYGDKGFKKLREELLNISDLNNNITDMLNEINKPRSNSQKADFTRFDEMIIVEENELKRNISKTILNIRGEAELKKLKDDTEIIENKNVISKFFGMFTGRNKLDDFMLEQIDIRENSIKKTLSKTLKLDVNYSMHELIAEIRMFINDNEDDDLVSDDVMTLKDLEYEIRKNFVIIDSKVDDIIAEKENNDLPVSSKATKEELIEMETYMFLNKYGYDLDDTNDTKDIVYKDTVASEIGKISDAIASSGII